MIMTKNEIKFVKGFLIDYQMSRAEFAKEAGIGVRTLYNALHGKEIKSLTYEKIINAMLCETLQRGIIRPASEMACISEEKAKKIFKAVVSAGIFVLVGLVTLLTISLIM